MNNNKCPLCDAIDGDLCDYTVVPEADLGMFSMFGRTGERQKGGPTARTMANGTGTFSGMWGHFYGVLRLLKVHLVLHDILWPTQANVRVQKAVSQSR